MRSVKKIAVLLAAVVALTLTTAGSAQAATAQPSSVSTAATCGYSTDWNKGLWIPAWGAYSYGFGYAGHYNGVTTVPSRTTVTAAGIEAQCLLVRYGDFNPGPIDGVFGSRSQAAMKEFQQRMNSWYGAGLVADGMPGPKSWPWLRWYEA